MGKRKDGSYATIQAYIPLEQITKLEEAAKAEDTSVSEIVRRALARFFLIQNPTDSRNQTDAA